MRVLAMESEPPQASSADFTAHLEAEARAVWDLTQTGCIREIYFRSDRPQAVILLEPETLEDAQRTLAQLPLVRAGLIEFEVIGLRPYPGFARLFADH